MSPVCRLIDIDLIKLKIEKMRSNILNITKEDFELTRDIFRILNIPVPATYGPSADDYNVLLIKKFD